MDDQRETSTLNRIIPPLLVLGIVILIFLTVQTCSAQIDPDYINQSRGDTLVKEERKLFFGGYIGIAIGSFSNTEIAPLVGYKILPSIHIAAGPKYRWYREGIFRSTHIYSGRLSSKWIIIDNIWRHIKIGDGRLVKQPIANLGIVLHIEREWSSLSEKHFGNPDVNEGRFWHATTLIGGGVRQGSSKFAINFMVLWDCNKIEEMSYANPLLRIEFNF